MTAYDLAPYFGYPCSVRLRCRGCGGAHVMHATPAHGKHVGELLLHGHTFNIEDVEQVWRQTEPPSRRRDISAWLARLLDFGRRGRAPSTGWV